MKFNKVCTEDMGILGDICSVLGVIARTLVEGIATILVSIPLSVPKYIIAKRFEKMFKDPYVNKQLTELCENSYTDIEKELSNRKVDYNYLSIEIGDNPQYNNRDLGETIHICLNVTFNKYLLDINISEDKTKGHYVFNYINLIYVYGKDKHSALYTPHFGKHKIDISKIKYKKSKKEIEDEFKAKDNEARLKMLRESKTPDIIKKDIGVIIKIMKDLAKKEVSIKGHTAKLESLIDFYSEWTDEKDYADKSKYWYIIAHCESSQQNANARFGIDLDEWWANESEADGSTPYTRAYEKILSQYADKVESELAKKNIYIQLALQELGADFDGQYSGDGDEGAIGFKYILPKELKKK